MLEALKKNAVSLISLVVAITALTYNTWRNELTERNRNIRVAGFEILKELAQLQLALDYATYEQNHDKGNPINVWTHVLTVEDLAYFTSPGAREEAAKLKAVWSERWPHVGEDPQANDQITQQIRATRSSVQATLTALK